MTTPGRFPTCPWCGSLNLEEPDYVDNGVGLQQCSPMGCRDCGAYQMGVSDFEVRAGDTRERRCGWFKGDMDPYDVALVRAAWGAAIKDTKVLQHEDGTLDHGHGPCPVHDIIEEVQHEAREASTYIELRRMPGGTMFEARLVTHHGAWTLRASSQLEAVRAEAHHAAVALQLNVLDSTA